MAYSIRVTGNILAVSRYILDKCAQDGKPLDLRQLQGILYLIEKQFLRKPIISPLQVVFQAWSQGPTETVSYHYFGRRYHYEGPIRISYLDEDSTIVMPSYYMPGSGTLASKIIDSTLSAVREMAPPILEARVKDRAWKKAYDKGAEAPINPELMRKGYVF